MRSFVQKDSGTGVGTAFVLVSFHWLGFLYSLHTSTLSSYDSCIVVFQSVYIHFRALSHFQGVFATISLGLHVSSE